MENHTQRSPEDDWPHPWSQEDEQTLSHAPAGQPRCADFYRTWTEWAKAHSDTAINAQMTRRKHLLSCVVRDIATAVNGRRLSLLRQRVRLRVSLAAMHNELARREGVTDGGSKEVSISAESKKASDHRDS